VREAYLQRARSAPERFAVIDASGSEDEVWAQVDDILQRRLAS
jgi:thymidylate kinase